MSNVRNGFTIVELIIVIVVIGILSTIGVLGYGASVKNAQATQVKNDLSHAASALQSAVNFSNSGYASDVLTEYTPNDGTVMTGGSISSGTGYCVEAYHTNEPTNVYYIDNTTATSGPALGACALASVPGAPNQNDPVGYGNANTAYLDPFVGGIVGWSEPSSDGGSAITNYRVRFVFAGPCAAQPNYTYTLTALSNGGSGSGGSTYTRSSAGYYDLVTGVTFGGCTITSADRVSSVHVSAGNSQGYGPERAYTNIEWTL